MYVDIVYSSVLKRECEHEREQEMSFLASVVLSSMQYGTVQ